MQGHNDTNVFGYITYTDESGTEKTVYGFKKFLTNRWGRPLVGDTSYTNVETGEEIPFESVTNFDYVKVNGKGGNNTNNSKLTAIKEKLNADCNDAVKVHVCNQVSLDTLNTKLDTLIDLMTKIAEPLTANEYEDECCEEKFNLIFNQTDSTIRVDKNLGDGFAQVKIKVAVPNNNSTVHIGQKIIEKTLDIPLNGEKVNVHEVMKKFYMENTTISPNTKIIEIFGEVEFPSNVNVNTEQENANIWRLKSEDPLVFNTIQQIKQETIYCDPNKANFVLVDSYYNEHTGEDVSYGEKILDIDRQIDGTVKAIAKITTESGTETIECYIYNGKGDSGSLLWNVTKENFKNIPKIEITTEDPRVNPAVYKFGVLQNCIEKESLEVGTIDIINSYGAYTDAVKIGLSKATSSPIIGKLTVNNSQVIENVELPADGSLVTIKSLGVNTNYDYFTNYLFESEDPRLRKNSYSYVAPA